MEFTSAAPADDPPARKARPKTTRAKTAKGAAAKVKADPDEPPPCEHLLTAEPSNGKAPARRSVRPGAPQSMPEMFNRMMGQSPAGNQVGGFPNMLKQQESAALRETTLTAAEERKIGRKQRDAYLRAAKAKGYDVVDNAKDRDYLKALVAKFAKRMKNRARYPDIEVTIVDAPIADGQSFPGGFLVFTSALLDEPDEATVAGIVAHELAHLDRGHLNEYARREKLAGDTFRGGPGAMNSPDQMMRRGMAIGSLMMNPFRPEHEHEADCMATTWLFQEGYSPHGFADFFTRMNARLRDQPNNPFWSFGRSHPYTLDRRRAVLDRFTQLQNWKTRDDLKLCTQNLKDRTPKPD